MAVLGVSADESLNPKSAQVLEDLLLTALHETGKFELLGRADIAGLIGFEKQQEALGCQQDVSCVAQIAGALDVPLIGTASIGKFGSVTILSFKLIDSHAAKVIVRASVNAASESEVPDAVTRLAEQVAGDCDRASCAAYARKSLKTTASGEVPAYAQPPETAAPSGGRGLGWVGVFAGVAIAGASVAFDTQAASSHDHTLQGVDFLPIAGYLVAATCGGLGIHRLVSR